MLCKKSVINLRGYIIKTKYILALLPILISSYSHATTISCLNSKGGVVNLPAIQDNTLIYDKSSGKYKSNDITNISAYCSKADAIPVVAGAVYGHYDLIGNYTFTDVIKKQARTKWLTDNTLSAAQDNNAANSLFNFINLGFSIKHVVVSKQTQGIIAVDNIEVDTSNINNTQEQLKNGIKSHLKITEAQSSLLAKVVAKINPHDFINPLNLPIGKFNIKAASSEMTLKDKDINIEFNFDKNNNLILDIEMNGNYSYTNNQATATGSSIIKIVSSYKVQASNDDIGYTITANDFKISLNNYEPKNEIQNAIIKTIKNKLTAINDTELSNTRAGDTIVMCSALNIDKPLFLDLPAKLDASYNKQLDAYIIQNNITTDSLKKSCATLMNAYVKANKTIFKKLTAKNVFISSYYNGYQYPIIDNGISSKINNESLFDINLKAKLATFASIASGSYKIEKQEIIDKDALSNMLNQSMYFARINNALEINKLDYKYLKSNRLITLEDNTELYNGDKSLYAIAVKNKDNNIVISYKGTNPANNNDLISDAYLMLNNISSSAHLTAVLTKALDFYNNIRIEYPNSKITLTGHSLGGYIAQMIALNTGDKAIVFSGPSASTYSNYFSRVYVPTAYNILNIARDGDPVVFGSGKHYENMIYYKSDSLDAHGLKGTIKAIEEQRPTHAYFYGFKNAEDSAYFIYGDLNKNQIDVISTR